MTLRAIVIKAEDNLANLVGPGKKGQVVQCTIEDEQGETAVKLLDDVPANHKFAFVDITEGEGIIKYGQNMGRASKDIEKGAYVHVHNIESNRGRGDLK